MPMPSPATDHVPQQIITPKRTHQSSGQTVHPPKSRPRSTNTSHGAFHPSFNPPPHDTPMADVEESDHSTSTQSSFQERQPDFAHFKHPDSTFYIPDSQYEFDKSHSQNTRVELLDAIAIARTISPTREQETRALILRKQSAPLNLTEIKTFASRKSRARNDPHARPNQKT